MSATSTIRKILFVTLWVTIGGGMLTLLVAAISKKNHEICRDYAISIKSTKNNLFVTEKDVEQLLMSATGSAIKGRSLSSFNLRQLEQLMNDNTWIKNAELYFDNQDVLHIEITEREPVARVFTMAGNSFYIDNTAKEMPLSDKLSAKVPVFNGFPDKKILTSKDSLLLNDVRVMATFILNDPFWMAQVSEIDITPERNFEMVPVVGNQIIRLGNGDDISKKFHRLFVFYNDVLSKTGFSKYRIIDVQYAGQIVASKQITEAKIDSVQLRKNVQKLLQEAIESQADTVVMAKPLTEKPIIKIDSTIVQAVKLKPVADKRTLPAKQAGQKSTSPNPLKSVLSSKPGEKKIPKAVMPRKDNG